MLPFVIVAVIVTSPKEESDPLTGLVITPPAVITESLLVSQVIVEPFAPTVGNCTFSLILF